MLIKITIEGSSASGRSTLAFLILQYLGMLGFAEVSLLDEDEPEETILRTLDARVQALQLKEPIIILRQSQSRVQRSNL